MFGEKVIARTATGRPIQARVWELSKEKVYICIDDVFEEIKGLDWDTFPPNRFPVAFPRDDVFEFDEALFGALVLSQKPNSWKALRSYGA